MKKLASILFSTRLTGMLFLLFALSMAIATFVEEYYGTQTAKALIYSATWFELIMLIFLINFIGNIFKYRLYRKEKWAVLLFHSAFILILIGAGITRYISEEGMMEIVEGERSNTYLSDKTYLNVIIDDNEHQFTAVDKPLILSKLFGNSYSKKVKINHKKLLDKNINLKMNVDYNEIKFSLVDYIPFKPDTNSYEFLHLVESSSGARHDHFIKKGESQVIHNVRIGFDNTTEINAINFYETANKLKIKTPHDGTFLRMIDQLKGVIAKDSLQDFNLKSLYTIAGLSFVVPGEFKEEGTLKDVTKNEGDNLDALVLKITANGKSKEITVKGTRGLELPPNQFSFEGLNYRVRYGAKRRTLVYGNSPKDKTQKQKSFYIKLRDFQLENYPGSQSPMSFASEITVISPEKTFDYKIFMNNILDYKGYRFFQSSYDIGEGYELTRLSVNRDYWGTLITYIGYFLLFGCLLLSLMMPKTRFGSLRKQLNKIKYKRKELGFVFALLISLSLSAQHKNPTDQQLDSVLQATNVSKEHANKFTKLIIQDSDGRMKPVNTFAAELLRKVHKEESFRGLDATQVFLSMFQNKQLWFNMPIIYLEEENLKVREILGLDPKAEYASLVDFFDRNVNYKLRDVQEEAFKSQIKSAFQKSIIKIDQRVNLFYYALEGNLLRIFPIKDDPTNKWVSPNEIKLANYKGQDTVVKNLIPYYKEMLYYGNKTNNYEKADGVLKGLINFQKKNGAIVYPNDKKIDLEIAYNKYDVFRKLFLFYLLFGIFFLLFLIAQILKNNKFMKIVSRIFVVTILITFAVHTLGLIARWYISGHAPWSNAYETIIYISWSIMLFGLFFVRKSHIAFAAASFVASMLLFFAYQSYLDPAIANLVPVLNSYWLMIHVAIIVGSYGPFILSFILGVVALFLMIITKDKNKKRLDLVIKELTVINEMSITIGLVMLTIGNFLGGMWANESWGRYWGWDPKETWALISIMIYAFVLHMRLIPGLRGRFTFNFVSIITIATIVMTYKGVNFFFSGLHAYQTVEGAKIPMSVWYSVVIITIFSIIAFRKYLKYYKK